jgi:U3 small nucleolar RNA-associated protein 10
MEDAVLARLEDTHPSVISEIYKYSNTLLNAIPAQSLLTSIQRSVRTEDFSRASFRSHLSFLAGDFSVRHPPLMNQIFCEIIAPFLLFTKPRQKTASALWEVLADSPLGNYELLKGCAPIMSDIQGKEDSSVRMGQIDVIISGRIAGNLNCLRRCFSLHTCLSYCRQHSSLGPLRTPS